MRFFSVFVLFFICYFVAAATRTIASSSHDEADVASVLLESEPLEDVPSANAAASEFTDRAFVENTVDADIEAATDAQIDAEVEADAQAEAEAEAEVDAEAEVEAEAEAEAEVDAESGIFPVPTPGTYNFGLAKDAMRMNAINDCGADNVQNWNCKLCNFASTRGFNSRSTFANPNKNTFGFVGIMPTDNNGKPIIFVSFRGTEKTSVKNWLTNLNIGKDPFPGLPTNVQVHQGFLGAYKDVQAQVLAAIAKANTACPDCRILLTGHSLGGSLATIAAADLITKKYAADRLSLYTFGSPRVGNDVFVTWFNGLLKDSFRITHADDAVIHVPFENMGFTHVGFNIHYPNAFKFANDAANQRFCGWLETDKNCQSKGIGFNIFKIGDAISQHLKYLDVNCGCGDDNINAFRFKQAKGLAKETILAVATLAGIKTDGLSLEQIKIELNKIKIN